MIRTKPASLIVLAILALAILMGLAMLPAAIQDSGSAGLANRPVLFSNLTPTPTPAGSGASGGGNGGG